MKFLSLALLVLLIGCTGIHDGVIVKKWMEPEHYESQTTMVTIGDNTMPMESGYTVPDKFYVQIQKDSLGKTYTNEFDLDYATWDHLEVGQYVKFK